MELGIKKICRQIVGVYRQNQDLQFCVQAGYSNWIEWYFEHQWGRLYLILFIIDNYNSMLLAILQLAKLCNWLPRLPLWLNTHAVLSAVRKYMYRLIILVEMKFTILFNFVWLLGMWASISLLDDWTSIWQYKKYLAIWKIIPKTINSLLSSKKIPQHRGSLER